MSVRLRLVKHVRAQGEELVADHVPEIDHAVGVAAHEARAEDDVGLAVEDRLEQPRVFLRVVFEVGVLHDHDVAGGGGEAGAQRGALAPVDFVVDDLVDQRRDLACAAGRGCRRASSRRR